VVGVPLSRVLHLKSAATALPCGSILAWRPALTQEAVDVFQVGFIAFILLLLFYCFYFYCCY
jgi:hypothetical protein